ncbi:MAG: DegT/DnrJ/EryC1/StrS family aminotransferase [Lachnospiraceae bacterium]|nr:DegT/DnrJ/EryC1/StrS family aminotransferase [Lachnospiraceae bacterium]
MGKDIFVTRTSMPEYEEFIEAIKPLWDSHWLTNMGEYHQELEKELKEYLEVPELSLMVNGHMALELVIQAFDFPECAEVITTPFTFISTTHAIVRNHLTPVFCDVKPEDGTIDETKLEDLITERTVAILPVHVYGNICRVEEIERIAYKYGLKVIYDAAHSFGESYKGRAVGSFGDASVFSFHATKVFNTIEGGAVAFSDHGLYEKLYNLKNFGIRGEELVTEVGANAKMNEMCAIMGLCNLRHISRVIDRRKKVCDYYDRELAEVEGIRSLRNTGDTVSNYGYYPVIIEKGYSCDRDDLYKRMAEQGIHPRKYFYPLTSDQACFKNKYRACELQVSRDLSKQVLALPLYEGMAQEDIERVMGVIKE